MYLIYSFKKRVNNVGFKRRDKFIIIVGDCDIFFLVVGGINRKNKLGYRRF